MIKVHRRQRALIRLLDSRYAGLLSGCYTPPPLFCIRPDLIAYVFGTEQSLVCVDVRVDANNPRVDVEWPRPSPAAMLSLIKHVVMGAGAVWLTHPVHTHAIGRMESTVATCHWEEAHPQSRQTLQLHLFMLSVLTHCAAVWSW